MDETTQPQSISTIHKAIENFRFQAPTKPNSVARKKAMLPKKSFWWLEDSDKSYLENDVSNLHSKSSPKPQVTESLEEIIELMNIRESNHMEYVDDLTPPRFAASHQKSTDGPYDLLFDDDSGSESLENDDSSKLVNDIDSLLRRTHRLLLELETDKAPHIYQEDTEVVEYANSTVTNNQIQEDEVSDEMKKIEEFDFIENQAIENLSLSKYLKNKEISDSTPKLFYLSSSLESISPSINDDSSKTSQNIQLIEDTLILREEDVRDYLHDDITRIMWQRLQYLRSLAENLNQES